MYVPQFAYSFTYYVVNNIVNQPVTFDYFQFLAVMNIIGVNTCMQVFVWIYILKSIEKST